MNRDTEWQDEGHTAEEERESGRRRKKSSLHVLRAAIYFHYARSDSFPIPSSTLCIVADWALSNNHLLMTHQQAGQHIIDMSIQIDASAFLSAAFNAETQLIITNIKGVCNEKYLLVLALFTKAAVWFYYCLRRNLLSFLWHIFIISAASPSLTFFTEGHTQDPLLHL